MRNSDKNDSISEIADHSKDRMKPAQPKPRHKRKAVAKGALLILIGFLVGMVTGYLFRARTHNHISSPGTSPEALMEQVNPPNGYVLPARFGNIGPQLITSGAIDFNKFVHLYEQSGQPLDVSHLNVLTNGINDPIIINRENANFLLNLFWAFGLANENPILTEGLMMNHGMDGMVNFASTGGWTLGTKPVKEIYASSSIIYLSDEQQKLLENVAAKVFRPCCNNPTLFPDCNHGMAMLGMLELMISQGATEEDLFEAAKYINAFWFLPQNFELARYLAVKEKFDFSQAEPRMIVGKSYASAAGFQEVHQWLLNNDKLPQIPGGVNNCGV